METGSMSTQEAGRFQVGETRDNVAQVAREWVVGDQLGEKVLEVMRRLPQTKKEPSK